MISSVLWCGCLVRRPRCPSLICRCTVGLPGQKHHRSLVDTSHRLNLDCQSRRCQNYRCRRCRSHCRRMVQRLPVDFHWNLFGGENIVMDLQWKSLLRLMLSIKIVAHLHMVVVRWCLMDHLGRPIHHFGHCFHRDYSLGQIQGVHRSHSLRKIKWINTYEFTRECFVRSHIHPLPG